MTETITTREAADILDIAANSVANMASEGRLPFAKKVGKFWRIDKAKLLKFAETYDRDAAIAKSYTPRAGYVSLSEACVIMHLRHTSSVLDAIKRGDIVAERSGKFWYVDEKSVHGFAARMPKKTKAKPKPAAKPKRKATKRKTEKRPLPTADHQPETGRKRPLSPSIREMLKRHNAELGVMV
jgi:excisionase family DNA binding protein